MVPPFSILSLDFKPVSGKYGYVIISDIFYSGDIFDLFVVPIIINCVRGGISANVARFLKIP